MDLISVILPVHNREFTIGRAIESVLNQSYSDIELIIIDDASYDNTVKMIGQYDDKRIVLIEGKNRGGAAKARNMGLKIAKGKYIAFQDSDDEWLFCKLEKQLSYMKKNNYKVSFTPYKLIESEKTSIVPPDYNQLDDCMISDILKKGNIIGTPTLVMDKNVIDNVGVFDESMSAWEDYELIIRIAKKYSIGCVKEILLHAYRQERCISTNYENIICSAMYIMRKHADFVEGDIFLSPMNIWMNERIFHCADFATFELYAPDLTKNEMEYIRKRFFKELCKKYDKKNYCLKSICGAFENRLKNKKFYLYGAGVIARETYERLKQKGILPQAFVVTTMDSVMKIDNIPVMKIDNNFDVNMPFLIAVSSKYHEEVVERIREFGYLNYSFSVEAINI